MKARKRGAAGADIAVQRLDDNRYVVTVDGIVRYVGTREECERRVATWVSRSPRCRHRRGRTAPTGFPATLEPQRTTLSIGTERGSRRSSSRRCQWPTRLFLPEINASRRSISVSIAEDAKCITANTENSAVKNACKININFAPALV